MTDKDLNYYMSLPYKIEFEPNDDGKGFTTSIPGLKGCISFGETIQEAYEMITKAKRLWIEANLDSEWIIPEPVNVPDPIKYLRTIKEVAESRMEVHWLGDKEAPAAEWKYWWGVFQCASCVLDGFRLQHAGLEWAIAKAKELGLKSL